MPATTTMDALTSVLYLTDHLPKWLQQVDQLSAYSSKKHSEYVSEYSRLLSNAKPRKKRTSSLHSLKPEEELPYPPPRITTPTTGATSSQANAAHLSPLEPGNQYLLAQAQRKRKLGTSIRSGPSGPPRFRSKQMAIIYYDAYVQEQLESIVKNIGGARNNLRKGKLSRSLRQGLNFRPLTRTGEDVFSVYSSRPKNPSYSATIMSRNSKTQAADVNVPNDVEWSKVDKLLEVAQSLCETAAHQVLRDGDCSVELKGVHENLEAALEPSRRAVELLKDEKEEDVEESDAKDSAMTLMEGKLGSPYIAAADAMPPLGQGATEIEVDDDSDASSIVVDISNFRTTRMNGIRA